MKTFWQIRDRQIKEQERRGGSDQGARSAVTGGKQMDGFVRKIIELMTARGVDEGNIYTKKTHLPGFFRPVKGWDIVVVVDGVLMAAIELKSQVGLSFGNNFNNRTEEAMGTALDIWTAYREGAFCTSPAPWLGYLFLLEDCPESRSPVRTQETNFPVFKEFRGASYAKRYELFCRKLVRERQYNAACFIIADRERSNSADSYIEPADDLSADLFLSQLNRHVGGRE